jgi:hypothetical protein
MRALAPGALCLFVLGASACASGTATGEGAPGAKEGHGPKTARPAQAKAREQSASDAPGDGLGRAPAFVLDGWWKKADPCPRGASLRGDVPPRGREIECVTAAGARHGYRATWNRYDHLSSIEIYDRGQQRARKDLRPWRFVVLSDIHIYPSGRIPRFARPVVAYVAAMKPRAVLITGDSTNGNKGDRFGSRRIALWWQRLHELLDPIYKAGIPVLPMAGNHDTYRKAHRQGYADAWKSLADKAEPLVINRGGNPPWYYSVDIDGTHLLMLDHVTQHLSSAQEAWIRRDLAGAKRSKLRLAFGHAPISSVIAPPQRKHRSRMLALFGSTGVDAFMCGHEHVLWDETLEENGVRVRQVISGTASGTYHFGLRGAVRRKWCQNRRCRFPDNGYGFRIKANREQMLRASFVAVDVIRDNSAIEVHPYRLGADGVVARFPRVPPGASGRGISALRR